MTWMIARKLSDSFPPLSTRQSMMAASGAAWDTTKGSTTSLAIRTLRRIGRLFSTCQRSAKRVSRRWARMMRKRWNPATWMYLSRGKRIFFFIIIYLNFNFNFNALTNQKLCHWNPGEFALILRMQPPGTDDKIMKMEPENQNLLKEAQKDSRGFEN